MAMAGGHELQLAALRQDHAALRQDHVALRQDHAALRAKHDQLSVSAASTARAIVHGCRTLLQLAGETETELLSPSAAQQPEPEHPLRAPSQPAGRDARNGGGMRLFLSYARGG